MTVRVAIRAIRSTNGRVFVHNKHSQSSLISLAWYPSLGATAATKNVLFVCCTFPSLIYFYDASYTHIQFPPDRCGTGYVKSKWPRTWTDQMLLNLLSFSFFWLPFLLLVWFVISSEKYIFVPQNLRIKNRGEMQPCTNWKDNLIFFPFAFFFVSFDERDLLQQINDRINFSDPFVGRLVQLLFSLSLSTRHESRFGLGSSVD